MERIGAHSEGSGPLLAGATFTLYLLHVPVGQFLAAMSPWSDGSFLGRLLVMGGTFGVVFGVADHTERRKAFWRKAIGSIVALVRPGVSV